MGELLIFDLNLELFDQNQFERALDNIIILESSEDERELVAEAVSDSDVDIDNVDWSNDISNTYTNTVEKEDLAPDNISNCGSVDVEIDIGNLQDESNTTNSLLVEYKTYEYHDSIHSPTRDIERKSGSSRSSRSNRSKSKYIDTDSESDDNKGGQRIKNIGEKNRRRDLNNLFNALKHEIPSLESKNTCPKVLILKEAKRLCYNLKEEQKQLKKLEQKLKQINSDLRKKFRTNIVENIFL